MKKEKQLILFGNTAFAEIAYEYFTHDSPYEMVAFTVHQEYLQKTSMFDLPVVAFETLEKYYSPESHAIFVASTYTGLNRLRTRISHEAKQRGYALASYISSNAFVWRNVTFGEHCFVFENNVIQPFVKVGGNVVFWSGNHIGHHSTIGDHCFVSSHVVVSGFVTIEQSCFLGVNATIANNLTIGRDCWIGPGATITQDIPAKTFIKPLKPEVGRKTTHEYFQIQE